MTAEDIITKFKLEPHPCEGGYFLETYRSEDVFDNKALAQRYKSQRSASTAIYYLLTPETFSEMHRIITDEVFHFYLGDPVEMLQLYDDGQSKVIRLGSNIFADEHVQLTVRANVWQGTRLVDGGKFALLGTTVAPGFEFEDYQSANREELIKKYPTEEARIVRLTHA